MTELTKCKTCFHYHNKSWKDGICDNYTVCDENRMFKPYTNADQIRNMTDDGLAYFLCGFDFCLQSTHPCIAEKYCRAGHCGMIDWLKEDADID